MKAGYGTHSGGKLPSEGSFAAPQLVFLVGFMGAGKSSVGRALGRRLGWSFEDLDDRVMAREGQTVEQIFGNSGEAGFRRAEHAALSELLSALGDSPRIIAVGGGAFVQPENAALLEGMRTVFLDAPVEELWRRCQGDDVVRPLRTDKEHFRELYRTRRPHYLRASVCIDTNGKDIQVVAIQVAAALGLNIDGEGAVT